MAVGSRAFPTAPSCAGDTLRLPEPVGVVKAVGVVASTPRHSGDEMTDTTFDLPWRVTARRQLDQGFGGVPTTR
jgi:hypothetical protein